jgi:acetyltransferase EpsM
MNNSFSIIGAGGHAKVIIEIIEAMGADIVTVMDNNPDRKEILGYSTTQAEDSLSGDCIVALGDNLSRKTWVENHPVTFGQAIHPSAIISGRTKIGAGTVVMAGAVMNADTVIGCHCIINTNAGIDHDCMIGDFVHIAPNAALAGGVTVGEGTHIGIGSSVTQGIRIGKWATIGAGAVIIQDVPDYAVVVGVPGRIIKYNAAQ